MNQKEKLKSRKIYYLEKVIKLNRKLFIEVGDARSRICNCEEFIEAAYSASKGVGLEKDVEENWEICWNELNGDGDSYWFDKKGNMIGSPI